MYEFITKLSLQFVSKVMNGIHSSPDQDKVDRLLADLERLRNKHISKELNSVTLPTKPGQNKKDISHMEHHQGSLPRMESRYFSIPTLLYN